jgi:hypothetical protein
VPEQTGLKQMIYISVDEWETFERNFRNALPAAQRQNPFVRHAHVVKMGNFTLITYFLPRGPHSVYFGESKCRSASKHV